jgi:hypothetical protein
MTPSESRKIRNLAAKIFFGVEGKKEFAAWRCCDIEQRQDIDNFMKGLKIIMPHWKPNSK